MNHQRIALSSLAALLLAAAPAPAAAETITFKALPISRATFKTEAPLETIVGSASGPAVSGTVMGDPAKPQAATGTIRVDLRAVKSGNERRDADMLGKNWLDAENEANRYAQFDLKGIELSGALEAGKEVPAKLMGTLTIKGKPAEVTADARIVYIRLTPEQLESQKRFGFTSDNLRVRATFKTSFTNHGMQVPQLLYLKVANDIQIETDLTLVRQ